MNPKLPLRLVAGALAFLAGVSLRAQSNYATPFTFTTLAGAAGSPSSTDGTGNAARFDHPSGVAVDGAGNVYVADTVNNTIRKITSGGVVTTLAGSAGLSGSADGTGSAARFFAPSGVAVDSAGTVYVVDGGNSTIRKITSGGVVTTLAGTAGVSGYADGAGSAARFHSPTGVAVDSAGNVYIADSLNYTIRKITGGGVVTTLAGSTFSSGSVDGTGSAAQFSSPWGVAVDSAGNVYVADLNNNTIRKITSGGVVTTLAGSAAGPSGSADGTGSAARFSAPRGVAVDNVGNVYVADSTNNTIRKLTSGGVVTTLAGSAGLSGSADGTGSAARFNSIWAVAVDSVGNVYAVDRNNYTIRWGALVPPAFTSALTAGGSAGQDFKYTATFSNTLIGYSASGLPAGLSFDTATGAISGTPAVAGTFLVTLGGTNGAGTSNATLTLTISVGATSHLINISSRAQVGTGDGVLIAGFVIGGTTPITVLIRAVGPTLGSYGVAGFLADPQLELTKTANGVNVSVASNDNWGGDAQISSVGASVGAFPMINTSSKDAAILITLQPGVYSAKASGVGGTTGVALIEVYQAP